jgi:hypothetical protein
MTREEIALFDKVSVQLQSFYDETAVLVKKDPKAEINEFKLKLINKVLSKANEILKGMKPFEDFSEFDVDSLPNNGDVAMILGQYINCLEELRKDNVHRDFGLWYWNIDGIKNIGNTEIRTYIPKKYKQ